MLGQRLSGVGLACSLLGLDLLATIFQSTMQTSPMLNKAVLPDKQSGVVDASDMYLHFWAVLMPLEYDDL